MISEIRQVSKRLIFGPDVFIQQCAIGLSDPQEEVAVWLYGLGAPLNVTYRNVIAAASPFTIGIGLERERASSLVPGGRLRLRFQNQGIGSELLGEIGLRPVQVIPFESGQLALFEARYCRNYCIQTIRLWARHLYHSSRQSRFRSSHATAQIRMTALAVRSLAVFYICPRPVVLVTAVDGCAVNIFPMDLIGPIGDRRFSLALHSTSGGIPLMEHSRKIAISSLPVEQARAIFELGKNHRKASVNLDQLPFSTVSSPKFGLPVPSAALRVRELEIEAVQAVGSHKLFVADIVEDHCWARGSHLHFVHGIYQTLRQKTLY